jgi:hypothetical protein
MNSTTESDNHYLEILKNDLEIAQYDFWHSLTRVYINQDRVDEARKHIAEIENKINKNYPEGWRAIEIPQQQFTTYTVEIKNSATTYSG